MDRVHLLLLGLPIFLFLSDLVHIFTLPPTPATAPRAATEAPPPALLPADVSPPLEPEIGGIGYGATVELKFCASCSYKSNAMTTKKMIETSFPGIDVILTNYPPTFSKRLLSRAVPVIQLGVFGIIMVGEHIFPRLGYMVPPPWYFSLGSNKFGAISSTWLLGNFVQSFLQSSGAFEIYYNGDLVFSKLKERRFPSELELQNLINARLHGSAYGNTI